MSAIKYRNELVDVLKRKIVVEVIIELFQNFVLMLTKLSVVLFFHLFIRRFHILLSHLLAEELNDEVVRLHS